MDKYTIKILKYLNKYSSKNNPISEEKLFNKMGLDKITFTSAIEQLQNDNKIISINNLKCFNNIATAHRSYYSTTNGKEHFKELRITNTKKIIKELFRSIVCPIIVSIITTLLTLAINH